MEVAASNELLTAQQAFQAAKERARNQAQFPPSKLKLLLEMEREGQPENLK